MIIYLKPGATKSLSRNGVGRAIFIVEALVTIYNKWIGSQDF